MISQLWEEILRQMKVVQSMETLSDSRGKSSKSAQERIKSKAKGETTKPANSLERTVVGEIMG